MSCLCHFGGQALCQFYLASCEVMSLFFPKGRGRKCSAGCLCLLVTERAGCSRIRGAELCRGKLHPNCVHNSSVPCLQIASTILPHPASELQAQFPCSPPASRQKRTLPAPLSSATLRRKPLSRRTKKGRAVPPFIPFIRRVPRRLLHCSTCL